MNPSPPPAKEERLDVLAALGAVSLFAGFGFLGALAPWLPKAMHPLGLVGPILGLGGFAMILGCVFTAIRRRTFLKATMTIALVGLLLVYVATFNASTETASWQAHARMTLARRQEAVRWIKGAQSPDRVRESHTYYKLPTHLADIVERGEAVSYRDEKGRRWITFPIFTHGIDNSQGYVWSETGAPPPREAFFEIIFREDLGGGWFWFRST